MRYDQAMNGRCVPHLLLLILSPGLLAATTLDKGVDEQAQLPYWELRDEGMSLRLVQRLPDQSRAFFLARGFNAEQVEEVAGRCVFQTVYRNLSHEAQPSPLHYRQRDWVIHHPQHEASILTREDWAVLWEARDAPSAARIAFQWALLPPEQTYEPGDYNWGMTMIDLSPGTRFDLEVRWEQFGASRSAVIEDLQCASDTPATP
jgi:hypothetical protein